MDFMKVKCLKVRIVCIALMNVPFGLPNRHSGKCSVQYSLTFLYIQLFPSHIWGVVSLRDEEWACAPPLFMFDYLYLDT